MRSWRGKTGSRVVYVVDDVVVVVSRKTHGVAVVVDVSFLVVVVVVVAAAAVAARVAGPPFRRRATIGSRKNRSVVSPSTYGSARDRRATTSRIETFGSQSRIGWFCSFRCW